MRRHHTRAALTALAGTCAVALAAPMAQAAPTSPSAVLPSTLTVECTGIGAVTVHTHGGTLTGATTDAGPVSMAGVQVSSVPAGQSGATAAQQGSVPANAAICDPVTLRNVPASSVLGSGSRAVDATVRFGVRADIAKVLADAASHPLRASYVAASRASDPAGYGPVRAFPATWGMQNYVNGSGSITAAYRAEGDNVIHVATHGQSTNVTASIVKVQIMATVMYQAQQQGRALTAWEKSELIPMIHNSSNDAATALWNHVGKGPAVARVLALMGLRNTVPGSGSYWGLTVTSAPDQVVLVDHFSRANPVLNATNRAYGLSLMRGVESDQNWGVTAGPGTDNAVKNGWLPRTDGWHVNSVGYLDDAPRHYTMAVLSQSPSASMGTLVARIQGASRLVWTHQHGVRGDYTGDGLADLVAVRSGRIAIAPSTGSGFGAWRTASGPGWGAMRWIGSAGDLNGDGRSELLAVKGDDLYAYRTTSNGTITGGTRLASGWGGFTAIAGVGDFDASGSAELVARDRAGNLFLYRTRGFSTPVRVRQIGHGWGGMRAIAGSGDFTNDGRADLVSVTTGGDLIAWNSTGTGLSKLATRNTNWDAGRLTGLGDMDGDEIGDIVRQRGSSAVLQRLGTSAALGTSTVTGVSLAGVTMFG